ncbi:uncharacterized protein BDZ99DRAFT_198134 [Mytilinidion resinicola]|uniref:MARVEL domain-containing protein n=1 Tax=Mytilinidion resinicola TaxID=574789 RepID=A0A6A6Z5K7_9PEZI|nr:uncharacterized protein BDZ99DRAFT_198134 [Mytilinidion resinicola]KAF2815537.1 hypothetical protein BDZ99DRAFT_198134 [Mytilinidion resinicola]
MDSREHIIAVPKWTLALRIVSLVLAVIILGLNAYGIRWWAFDKLIFSLVVCLCTIGVVVYMVVATLAIPKAYNMWAFLALDIWMVIFWLIQFALVASLAAAFADATSWAYSYGYSYYWKRGDLSKRDTTTYGAYYGALVAGAVFGAFNFILFVVNLIIFSIHLHKHRLSGAPSTAPPGYNGNAAVPIEKYENDAQPYQLQPQQMPQHPQPVAQPQYGHPQYAQPQHPTPPQFTTPYTQGADPVSRQEAISPISNSGHPVNASELSTPQHTGGNPNVVELSSPQHTGNPNAVELGPGGYK